ncbi:MAG: hypothetical protein H6807_13385 [Planctomycetes bacterium]|nr:hypothetical protein [Planctomycetota bacterium]
MTHWQDHQGSPDDQAIDRLLGLLDDVEPSPGFRRRVLRAIVAEGHAPLARRLRWPRVAAAAAALMLIVAGWALVDRGPRPVDPRTPDLAAADSVGAVLDGLSELDLLAVDVNELDTINDDWFGG